MGKIKSSHFCVLWIFKCFELIFLIYLFCWIKAEIKHPNHFFLQEQRNSTSLFFTLLFLNFIFFNIFLIFFTSSLFFCQWFCLGYLLTTYFWEVYFFVNFFQNKKSNKTLQISGIFSRVAKVLRPWEDKLIIVLNINILFHVKYFFSYMW